MNDQSTILDGCGVNLGAAMHFHFFRRMRAASIRMYELANGQVGHSNLQKMPAG
jgi:hypothetical protein